MGVRLTPNGVQVAFDLRAGFLYLIQVPKGTVEI